MNTQKPASILTSTLHCIIAGIFSGFLIAVLLGLIVILLTNYAQADTAVAVMIAGAVDWTNRVNRYIAIKMISILFHMIALPLCGMWHTGKFLSTSRQSLHNPPGDGLG